MWQSVIQLVKVAASAQTLLQTQQKPKIKLAMLQRLWLGGGATPTKWHNTNAQKMQNAPANAIYGQ
jgi:hypothetical protein